MRPSEKILAALKEQKELEKQMTLEFASAESRRPYRADWEGRGVDLHVEVEDFDRYSVLLTKIRMKSGKLEADAAEMLKEQAARLSSEANGLGETFRLVEADEEAREVVLRTPVLQDPSDRFFEIVLRGGCEAELSHYVVSGPPRRRTESAATMSIEMFQRLIDYIVDVLGERARV